MNEKIEQAFTTVAKVCAEHRGPLADHQVIQAALIALRAALEPTKEQADGKGAED